MRYIFLLFATTLFFLLPYSATSQNTRLDWAVAFGGPQGEDCEGIVTDSSGNVYVVGTFRDTVDFDPGSGVSNLIASISSDIFVVKLDSTGNFLWVKHLESVSSAFARDIAIDASQNIYVTGSYSWGIDADPGSGTHALSSQGGKDYFVVKLNSGGEFIWAESFGGTGSDEIASIALDSAANIHLAGNFVRTVDFDPGPGTDNRTSAGDDDLFIHKLDSSGNHIWVRTAGGAMQEDANSLTVDSDGNVIAVGSFEGSGDFNPGAGSDSLSAIGSRDFFVLKLNSGGGFEWAKRFGGLSAAYAYDVVVDDMGAIYSVGSFFGTVNLSSDSSPTNFATNGALDIFFQKLNASGEVVWAKRIGGMSSDLATSITIDAQANIYTTGNFGRSMDFNPNAGAFSLSSAGSSDVYIQKMDSSGNFIWARTFGGSTSERGTSIALDRNDHVLTTGYFQYTTDLDPANGSSLTYTSNGSNDAFIHKLYQCGITYTWDSISSCDPYTWINGVTYSSSNYSATRTYYDAGGCDSVVRLSLTINTPDSVTHSVNSCTDYTWINGITYTKSNNSAMYTLTNRFGCDSVISLDLSINSNTVLDTQTACDSFVWIDGVTYTSSTSTPTWTLTNSLGCDSTILLDLTINPSPDVGVTRNGRELTVVQVGASYRWLDCNDLFAVIPNKTGRSFIPDNPMGAYAVQVDLAGCIDTSACFSIDYSNVNRVNGPDFRIYPNPATDVLNIESTMAGQGIIRIEVLSSLGNRVLIQESEAQQLDISQLASGFYYVRISSDGIVQTFKFCKR